MVYHRCFALYAITGVGRCSRALTERVIYGIMEKDRMDDLRAMRHGGRTAEKGAKIWRESS